jgi:NADPH-dependent 2,4-dienoyl-CoA reductase/sulfur reductase-like enzyme
VAERPTRVVVVGADAAGMSAAHQALRTARRSGRELAITVLDKGTHTSYSSCGIPYWMAGDVDSGDDLVARTADQHREAGIDLRLGVEVVSTDLQTRTLTTGSGEIVEFDELVVATGAPAVVPDWALRPDGTTYDGVGAVKTLDDGAAWAERFAKAGDGAHVVVVGAGYIGVEVAEAALKQGFGVTVLTRGRGMSMLEDEMADLVNVGLCDAGAEVVLGAEVTGLVLDGDRVTGVTWAGGSREADLVVVATGVRPATSFLDGTGIELTED